MLLLHVSAPISHHLGGGLQRNIFTTNDGKDVDIWSENTVLSIKGLLKWINRRKITGILHFLVIYVQFLIFIGPYILIYSCSTTNKMHLFLKIFIIVKRSTCFGRSFCPSSGAQNCVYSNRYMSNSCCYRGRDVPSEPVAVWSLVTYRKTWVHFRVVQ